MQPFTTHAGRAVVLLRDDVDTDQIIPKQFLKRIERTGFGEFLFYDWRRRPDGTSNPEFPLNHPEAAGSTVLLAGNNFGCGSSREHAPWALQQWGFRAVVAPSFADIFFANCCQTGLLPVVLPRADVAELARHAESFAGHTVTIDLRRGRISDNAGFDHAFTIDSYRRDMLLQGLDEIGATLRQERRIAAYERRRAALGWEPAA
jgi:3-isopropylmalate/(R)-2-methylmalate dehydratase small subunit